MLSGCLVLFWFLLLLLLWVGFFLVGGGGGGRGRVASLDLYKLFSMKVSLSQLQPFRDKQVYALLLSSLSWRS